MIKGGYAMVDFTGLDLSDPGTISGIYTRTKEALETGKPIVISGIVNGDQAFTPMVAYGGVESATSVFLSFFPITLHISNLDAITI